LLFEEMLFLKPEIYQPIACRIYDKLAPKLKVALPASHVEHIGSSAIAGCMSKGDLDIYVGVESNTFQHAIRAIEGMGFTIKQNTFRSDELCPFEGAGFPADVGIQLVAVGSKFEFFLIFKNRLNASEALRQEYNQLKEACVGLTPEEYRKMKSIFIASVLARQEK
jgi:GrpB-like predicted nucleotidyltransferase (UPF0157 family)